MRYSGAERPTSGGKPYHIEIRPGQLPRYVLLPGSPERADSISKMWKSRRRLASKREFVTYSGTYKGVPLATTSLGIGSAAASIALEELASIGADTFIRVGSTGSIQKHLNLGDLIINVASVRFDGTTNDYVPPEYPAYANHEVTSALIESAQSLGYDFHVGISCSTSSFYAGQSRSGFKGYTQPWIENRIHSMRRAGVLNFEEETATVFVLSSLFGLRAGAISFVIADRVRDKFEFTGERESILVANEAMRILNDRDTSKRRSSK